MYVSCWKLFALFLFCIKFKYFIKMCKYLIQNKNNGNSCQQLTYIIKFVLNTTDPL
jgi:hypothetical protein